MRHISLTVLSLFVASCQSVPSYYDIGVVHREITTRSPEAQLWFDRGLALTYGFNHEEAIRCFERAAQADPNCAMAHWGKAYALGPNYNNMDVPPEAAKAAFENTEKARAASGDVTKVERDLIEALRARYPTPTPGDRPPLEKAFAEAMQRVRSSHPDDADVASITAESMMLLEPWKLWTPAGKMARTTPAIRGVLEPALQRWPKHPGLCHLYIHTMEAGPEVGKATAAAEALEDLTPGIGHLVHMPSHIYIWTGRYPDAVRVNQIAVAKDNAYAEYAGRANFYTLYRLHNYHFIAYGAMFTGQRAVALAAAREIPKQIPPELFGPMVDFLDVFVATPLHVMVRFGMWNEILAEPEPKKELLAARAVWRYARGIALASLGRVEEAQEEGLQFLAARSAVPQTRMLFNNRVAKILAVADAVLAGEIAYRKGDHDEAFVLLRQAVAIDEQMNYDEPWGWMEPARHALGALLTEQGRYKEAIEVYRANLKRFPENGWALHGLAECLRQAGKKQEAAAVQKRFEVAFGDADVQIPGSCYCRTR